MTYTLSELKNAYGRGAISYQIPVIKLRTQYIYIRDDFLQPIRPVS